VDEPGLGQRLRAEVRVQIPSFQADLTVTVRMQDQEFAISGSPVYEGTAGAEGTMLGVDVSGDAWID
jgi:hypothetical protein